MNDLEVVEIIDKHTDLIRSIIYKRKVSRYFELNEFKSELFLRIRNNLKDNEKTHFSYISMVANQVATEQYKKHAFLFSAKRCHDTEEAKAKNEALMGQYKESGMSYCSTDFDYINLINDMSGVFSGKELEIIKMLSRGFSKKEISEHLSIAEQRIYSIISSKIRPRLRDFLADKGIETTETVETIARNAREY